MLRELTVLKQTMGEWKAQQAASNKGKMSIDQAEVEDLRLAVQRLQEDLFNKDEHYRKKFEDQKIKISLYDSLEKAFNQREQQVTSLEDAVADLKSSVDIEKNKCSKAEQKLIHMTEERQDLMGEIQELKNFNQE